MRVGALVLSSALLLAGARSAEAAPSSRLVYGRAPEAASCPAEPALRKAVAARVGYDPFFPWAKQTIIVQVWRERGRHRARVELVDEGGTSRGTRELSSSGTDCSELFDAMALAISIALDAVAAIEEEPVAAPAAPGEEPSARPPEPPPAPPVVAPPPPPRAEAPLPPAEPAPPLLPFVGVDALTSQGTAPSAALSGALFGGLRVGSLSAALELRLDAPAQVAVPGGDVSSWLFGASVVPCGHLGAVALCGLGTLGSIQSRGDVPHGRSDSALLVAVGGRLGIELPIASVFFFRAHGDALYDLRRPTLALDGTGVWTAPPVAFAAGFGVAVHFP